MKAHLNTLHKANDCMMVSAHQPLSKQSLCIVKSVLKGVVSSLTGCNISLLFDWECKSIKSNGASGEEGRALKKSRGLFSPHRRFKQIFISAK